MAEDNQTRKAALSSPESRPPEVQTLTPENSAAWVERYVAWASRVLDRKASSSESDE